jgi:hypothetical protein
MQKVAGHMPTLLLFILRLITFAKIIDRFINKFLYDTKKMIFCQVSLLSYLKLY